MRRYHGRRGASGVRIVWVEEEDGRLRWVGRPGDWEWGPGADGPRLRKLALALCADAAGVDATARCFESFAAEVLSEIPDSWDLREDTIAGWVRAAGG